MQGQDEEGTRTASSGPWDALTVELQALRHSADDVTFAEISRRISQHRMAAGASEHAARIARSSVHYSFQLGRPRLNIPLVREIVTALGEDEALVDEWVAACRRASAPVLEEPEPEPVPPATFNQVALLMVACMTVNLVGREFVDFFHFPIYLDMIGTAIAAIALGPWRGVSVGVTTNVIGIIGSGVISLPFAAVQIAGALVWGYGVHRYGMGRTLVRFFSLNVITAFVCSLIAVPVIVTFLGDDLDLGHNVITQLVEESVDRFTVAVSFSNLLTSMGDKLISGFVALVVISGLSLSFRHRIPLVFADHIHAPITSSRTQP
jgi:energy-coupling factor transport system substrate-specific component